MIFTSDCTVPQRFSFSRKPETPEEWAAFWIAHAETFSKKKGEVFTLSPTSRTLLIDFLCRFPCHPKSIKSSNIVEFLRDVSQNHSTSFEQIKIAIVALFRSLSGKAPSECTAILDAIESSAVIPASASDDLQKKLLTELELRKYSQCTIRTYTTAVKKYCSHLSYSPSANDQETIKEYLLTLKKVAKLAPRTINLTSAALTFFYEHIVKTPEVMNHIPRMKPGKDLPKVYGQGDIGKILASVQNPKHLLVLLLIYGCGLRLEEIRKLRVNHINWDRNVILIRGKGSKERILPIDDSFGIYLKQYLVENENLIYLFEGMEKGKPYARRTIQKIYDHACEKADINRTGGVHSLRHSYATHLLEQGVDINKIKTLMGHSSIKTTQIYTHVSKEEIAKIRSPLAGISFPGRAHPK